MTTPANDTEAMAMRDAFAMAALIGLLVRTQQYPSGMRLDRVQDYADSLCNDAFVLGETMMRVRANRPLP